MPDHVLIYGDSIAVGQGSTFGGWSGLLEKTYTIQNAAVPGDTSDTILGRITISKADVIIFQVGINDTKSIGDTDQSIMPLDVFSQNMRSLISIGKQIAEKVVCIGLTRVDESKTTPVHWEGENTHVYFKNDQINEYDQTLSRICDEEDVVFVPVYDLLCNTDLIDGLHPNDNGYDILYKTMENILL